MWNPMTTRYIMQTLIYVISMEFLLLSRRRSSVRNVPVAKGKEKWLFSKAKKWFIHSISID